MNGIKAIILAAGEGIRMKSNIPKVLHKVMDKAMIEYVYNAAKNSGISDICIVVGHKGKEVEENLDLDACFVTQAEQLGTGHAVMCADSFISDDCNIVVLYGDTPLIQSSTLSMLVKEHIDNDNSVTVISADVLDPTGYGRIIRDTSGSFLKIVEHKDASESELKIKEINSGIYCFKSKALKDALSNLTNKNVQNEYYLTDCLSILRNCNEKIGVLSLINESEILGVNNRVQLAYVSNIMKENINNYHMISGVTLIDPKLTFIGADVEIGVDSIVYPNCFIEGNTKIGEGCIIGPGSRIIDCTIEDNVSINESVVLQSKIASGTKVGPFAYIRPNCTIGKNVKIGDFVEIKNSVIGNGTKASHLTYVGDSDVGDNVNFGCGSVTVNYNGRNKYRTIIEDNVFIGCNTNLIAPVTVKESSYTAAGSTITEDVPKESLGIARARQVIKKDWRLR